MSDQPTTTADACAVDEDPATEAEVGALVQRCEQANAALIRGDIRRYVTLIAHAGDYTLLAPFGGPPTRGFDSSDEHLDRLARFFRGGTAELELVQSYAATGLVVLVLIERQWLAVAGLPEQEWSLRVTLVWRRQRDQWQLVHRHADPLVRDIGLERAAEIARA
jgi:ketosteroid isomerase-like protein